MKKIVILFFLLLLTGCTAVRIDTSSIDTITNVVLSKNNKLFNRIGKGYKYYVPRGVNYIDNNDYNDKLYTNGDYYYLYIDTISYYYNVTSEYVEDSNAYYSKALDINGKKGYLEINKVDDKYLVEFMYNYAKIEALVDYNRINDVVLNSSYILSTIKFNSDVIKLMLDTNYFTSKEEQYDIFTSKKTTNKFLEYSEE